MRHLSSHQYEARRPWLLLVVSVVLGTVGVGLLTSPAPRPQSAARPSLSAERAAPSPSASATPSPLAAASAAARPARRAPRTSASPSDPGPAAQVPPRGDGPGGDQDVQRVLEQAWPADLPAAQAEPLLAAGRRVLLADVTGVGRGAFPTAFPGSTGESVISPSFTRIRVQAAIARSDPDHPNRAIVHLVWAGADRGGTYTDGRLSDIFFTHSQGGSTWLPQPPTTS
ncbi:hypothetical protein ABT127_34735 [Streptomyces sp. NPDC001904]|uniref:hypothetical protein n=1 Tax=Streptomyces sp. NPDC001904 TaxID=3154531 RepID=UPI00332878F2